MRNQEQSPLLLLPAELRDAIHASTLDNHFVHVDSGFDCSKIAWTCEHNDPRLRLPIDTLFAL